MTEHINCHCCPKSPKISEETFRLNRRSFLASASLAGAALGGLSFTSILQAATEEEIPMPESRKPLLVKPILIYDLPQRQVATSWRSWGGIDSKETAQEEVARITRELQGIKNAADFPVEFFEVSAVGNVGQMADHPEVAQADLLIVYGAGGGIDPLKNIKKDAIIFQRWKSGPVYLQYEIVSPRFLRQHTDTQKVAHILPEDVVTDSLDELTWRLRSLCGLKNARGSKIMTVGGASAWAQPEGVVPKLVENVWKYQFHDISYPELG